MSAKDPVFRACYRSSCDACRLALLTTVLLAGPAAAQGGFAVLPGERSVVEDLIDFEARKPNIDLTLEIEHSYQGRNLVAEGKTFTIAARTERVAYLVLLNVDEDGTVTVLYPLTAEEMSPTAYIKETFRAVPPFGAEVLKLVAFRHRPHGMEDFLGQRLDALDPRLLDLYSLLRDGDGQAWLEVMSEEE